MGVSDFKKTIILIPAEPPLAVPLMSPIGLDHICGLLGDGIHCARQMSAEFLEACISDTGARDCGEQTHHWEDGGIGNPYVRSAIDLQFGAHNTTVLFWHHTAGACKVNRYYKLAHERVKQHSQQGWNADKAFPTAQSSH
jgi:hypothetical protein